MSIEQIKDISQMSSAERELTLRRASDQFLRGEITAIDLQKVESLYNFGLKSAVLALAERNIKQRKV